uniref:Uncharacterized protein n=1 Tax=Romanomermis culicivorax TaxID=13658 RepID=A0A915JFI1_ROMCU
MIVEEQDSENEVGSSELPALGHQERLAIEGPIFSTHENPLTTGENV